jgi:hypothetical protein
MQVEKGWKPGEADRRGREKGFWVSRPYGTKARETRAHDKAAWRTEAGAR